MRRAFAKISPCFTLLCGACERRSSIRRNDRANGATRVATLDRDVLDAHQAALLERAQRGLHAVAELVHERTKVESRARKAREDPLPKRRCAGGSFVGQQRRFARRLRGIRRGICPDGQHQAPRELANRRRNDGAEQRSERRAIVARGPDGKVEQLGRDVQLPDVRRDHLEPQGFRRGGRSEDDSRDAPRAERNGHRAAPTDGEA
ncbi:MAG: hypothetical protein U0842_26000 [Candidatus Binatia bacterium]